METKETKWIKINVHTQGKPIVNYGYIKKEHDDIVAISIDMRSKYCVTEAFGEMDEAPMIVIGITDRSIHLKENTEEPMTVITLPEFKGWSVWCAEITRYTMRACLIKENNV